MTYDRRAVMKGSSAVFLAFSALSCSRLTSARSANAGLRLIPDPDGLIDLPEGFSYRTLTRTGKPMSDGFFTPGRPDGMACFAHPTDSARLLLVRNHENVVDTDVGSPFGDDNALMANMAADKIYDTRGGEGPFIGGTTTLEVDAETGEVIRDHVSLIGTSANCAGGATPWGSWLTCEEVMVKTGEHNAEADHGFVFEVPSAADGPVDPVPLKAMGRFAHEATSVDPETGVIYLTEDHREGLFYRFLSNEPGNLRAGGRLQALVIKGWKSADTRNWPMDWSFKTSRRIAQGQSFAVEWIDMDDVESPNADLNDRGFAAGAAMFCRGEGLAYGQRTEDGKAEHYFTATEGGNARSGQVWSYAPGEGEGTADEQPGTLTLVYESTDADTLDLCDNLAVAPWGDLILCEDGRGDNYLRALAPDGSIYDLARNAHDDGGEFCGACFSPDGSTLFVNVQVPGMTYAITGPWGDLSEA